MPVIDKKKAKTAGATLVIAAAAGFFMQNGVPLPGGAPLSKPSLVTAAVPNEPVVEPQPVDMPLEAPAIETVPEVTRAGVAPILIEPPKPVLPFAEPMLDAPVREAALEVDPAPVTDIAPVPPAATPECEVGLTAASAPAAMVALVLESPCHAGEVVEITHDGLRINEHLDDSGMLRVNLPALAEEAVFTATFADGSRSEVDIFMPTLADYERIALVWQGVTGMGLHALEGGATYGAPGHMHANHMGEATRATAGDGGFVTVAGSVPGGWTADIYTYPISLIEAGHSPEVSVEAEIMAEACEAPTRAILLRVSPRDGTGSTDLSFGAPGCDAVGEFLVLKNLPQDLKIASN